MALFRIIYLLLAIAAAGITQPAAAATVKFGGSSTGIGIMRLIGEDLRRGDPDLVFQAILELSSGGGVKGVAKGLLDLALTSRDLTDQERASGLVAHRYGTSALVVAGHRATTAKDLSFDDLAAIYAGERLAWPDGTRIRLILNPPDDTNHEILRSMSPRMPDALARALGRPGLITAPTDASTATEIERTPGAIGVTMLSVIASERRPLMVFALSGVTPSVQTIADGTYPWTKPLFVVTRRDMSEKVARVVAHLRSQEGHALLAANGIMPAEE